MRYSPKGADDIHRTLCVDDIPSPRLVACGLDRKKQVFRLAFFLSFTHKIAVSEKDTTSYHRKEISEYSSTSFYIGEDITQNDIKAKYENGILSLTIPKLQPRITEKSYIAIE